MDPRVLNPRHWILYLGPWILDHGASFEDLEPCVLALFTTMLDTNAVIRIRNTMQHFEQ